MEGVGMGHIFIQFQHVRALEQNEQIHKTALMSSLQCHKEVVLLCFTLKFYAFVQKLLAFPEVTDCKPDLNHCSHIVGSY